MRLEKIVLQNFRNHMMYVLELDPKLTVIVGDNGTGKTNILEGINLLARGESFREGKVEEMVGWGEELGRVRGRVVSGGEILRQSGASHSTRSIQDDTSGIKSLPDVSNSHENVDLEVVVTRGMVQGKRVAKRRFLVNGVGRQKKNFVGNFYVVSFRPEDLRLVEGSPGRRRKMMDEVLTQADGEYGRCLLIYGKALTRRNKLLDMIREGKTSKTALTYWNQSVIKNGEIVQKKRREFGEFLDDADVHRKFGLSFEYEPSVMSEKRMEEYADREIAAGYQLIGPHRDDFKIMNNEQKTRSNEGKDLAVYGSRGEQRLGVLWLKLMSLEYLEEKVGVRPVMLLDDIYSELDHDHRELVVQEMGRQQTVLTSADKHYVDELEDKGELVEL